MKGIILDSHDRKMALQELESHRNEMLEKLCQMKDLIRDLSEKDFFILQRAEQYWLTSIENNLSAESGSFLGSMTNFSDTLKELKEHTKECDAGSFDGVEVEKS